LHEKRSAVLGIILIFDFDFRQCDSPVVPIAGLDFSNRHRLTNNQHQHQLTNNQHPLQLTNNQQAIHASNGVQLSSALRRITGVHEAKGKYIFKILQYIIVCKNIHFLR